MNPVYVLVEYSPVEERVIIRGIFSNIEKTRKISLLNKENQRNCVGVFQDTMDAFYPVFSGLAPSDAGQ